MAKFAPGYPLPRSADEFERLCLKLLRRHWQLPQLERFRDPDRAEKGNQPDRDQRTSATRRRQVRSARFAQRVDGRRDQGRCGPGREPEASNRALRDRDYGRQARGLAAFVVRSQPRQPQGRHLGDRGADLGRYRGAARRVSSNPHRFRHRRQAPGADARRCGGSSRGPMRARGGGTCRCAGRGDLRRRGVSSRAINISLRGSRCCDCASRSGASSRTRTSSACSRILAPRG